MQWRVANATDLQDISSGSFDLVLDKSTFDAIAAMRVQEDVVNLLAEVSRVLRPGGVYFLVTLNEHLMADPEKILCMPHLAFDVQRFPIGTRSDCACLCCRKLPEADRHREAQLAAVLQAVSGVGASGPCQEGLHGGVYIAPRSPAPTCLHLSGLGSISEVMDAVRAWTDSNAQASPTSVCSAFAVFITTLPSLLSPGQLRAWRWARKHGPARTTPETMPREAQDLRTYCDSVVGFLWKLNHSTMELEDACEGFERLEDSDFANLPL